MKLSRFIDYLVSRSKKQYGLGIRILATLIGATLFIICFPMLVLWAGDSWSGSLVVSRRSSVYGAVACFMIGIPWMLGAIFWQLSAGKGTPVPVVPTKQFLQNGPYRYVRNPMMLGFFLYICGWVFISNHWGACAAGSLLIAFFLAEIKVIEEPELEKRFGDAYREFKKETPFIIPRLGKK